MCRLVFLVRGVLLAWLATAAQCVTIEELEGMVSRHSNTLQHMSTYLVKTDQFWRWYTSNHRRLNAMMADGATAVPGADRQLEEMSQRLRLIETELQSGNVENQVAQLRRLQSLEEAVVRLTENLTATIVENEHLRRETELGRQDVDKLLMFVRQLSIVSNATGQLMKEQVRTLSERVSKTEENVTGRMRVHMEKEQQMLAEITELKEKLLTLEEKQNVTTEANTFFNNSVTSINEEIKNISDTAKQFPAIESRLNTLRDKMESFESAGRTLRGLEEFSESKMLTLEDQLNNTREELKVLTEQTNQLLSHQENTSDTRSEFVKMKDQLQNLHDQSLNTGTRFAGVQRSVESVGNEISGIRSSVAAIDGRLNNVRNQIDGIRSTVSVTQGDITTLKDQVESIRTTPAGLEELRDKVAEIEKKVEAKSVVRVRGDELLNSITSSTGAIGSHSPSLFSNALDDLPIQNIPG